MRHQACPTPWDPPHVLLVMKDVLQQGRLSRPEKAGEQGDRQLALALPPRAAATAARRGFDRRRAVLLASQLGHPGSAIADMEGIHARASELPPVLDKAPSAGSMPVGEASSSSKGPAENDSKRRLPLASWQGAQGPFPCQVAAAPSNPPTSQQAPSRRLTWCLMLCTEGRRREMGETAALRNFGGLGTGLNPQSLAPTCMHGAAFKAGLRPLLRTIAT